MLGGYFTTWCDADARDAVARAAKALDVQDELQFPDAELARSAAFIISASEGGNQYLPALRREPERFEPHSRERLLAGAMIPQPGTFRPSGFARTPGRRLKPCSRRQTC